MANTTKPRQKKPVPRLSKDRRRAVDSAPSGYWANELATTETPWPVRGVPGMKLCRAHVLTTGEHVSNNAGTAGTRRWTPPHNATEEDMIDLLTINKAKAISHLWPSAIRYDHGHPSEHCIFRPITVDPADDAPAIRMVRLAPANVLMSQAGRRQVRVSFFGIDLPTWAGTSLEVTEDLMREIWE